jgi:multidrug resistance protein, MATE family
MMRPQIQSIRDEIRPMLRLAAPLVLAEISWVLMAIVDTMMVGRLPNGAEAIGAVSLGNSLFFVIGIFGSGMLLGLDAMVSQSFGAGRVEDCHRSLVSGIYFIVTMTPFLMTAMWFAAPMLGLIGIAPPVLNLTIPYLRTLLWGAPPLMLYFAFRRYLQGMNRVKPVAVALITANIANFIGNYILVYGNWGAPAMGVVGSAWSTSIARVIMISILLGYTFLMELKESIGLRYVPLAPDFSRIRRLLVLGFPAAMHISLEVGVFAAATALAGTLGAVPLAAHQIALHTASFTFMVPLGIASAAAVRVGQRIGRKDPRGAASSGWTAIALGAAFMTFSALVFLTVPAGIVRLYTHDREVIAMGSSLLIIAAFFQLFDGIQSVAIGALRGTGETRTAMFSHLVCDWAFGLPVAWYFCFRRGWGVSGLWIGLSLAMILAGIVLLFAWSRRIRRFAPPTGS